MSDSSAVALDAPVEAQRRPAAGAGTLPTIRRFLRSSVVGTASLGLLLFVVGTAVFADRLAPYDPIDTDYAALGEAPSREHLLGTDSLGRDVLSRLIYGARITLVVGVSSVVLGDGIGFLWGLISGYAGRRFDVISQRLLDILMAFPALILALLLMAGLGAGLATVIIAIAVTRVPLATRVIRSVVLTAKEQAFVEAARALGASPWRAMARHLAPQCVAPLLVVASFNLGTAIFAEAALSFLGVGVPPPTPSWAACSAACWRRRSGRRGGW